MIYPINHKFIDLITDGDGKTNNGVLMNCINNVMQQTHFHHN